MKTSIVLKTFLIAGLTCFLLSGKIAAQENKKQISTENGHYKNAIGLRLGETSGLTYDRRFDKMNSVKFILGAFPYTYGVTILYERFYATKATGLDLYYGLGGHIAGAYNRTHYYYNSDMNRYVRTYGNSAVLGGDLIGGIEYNFPKIPMAISFDFKPFIEFTNGYGPYVNPDPGFSVKYTF